MEDAAQMVEKYADQVVSAIRDVAPEVWRAALLSAYGAYLVPALIFLLVSAALAGCRVWTARYAATRADAFGQRTWEEATAALSIFAVIAGIVAVGMLAAMPFQVHWSAMSRIADLVKP